MLNNIGIPLKNCNKNKTITYIPTYSFLFTKNAFDEMLCPLKPPELEKKSININPEFSLILETKIIEFSSKNNTKIITIMTIIIILLIITIFIEY